MAYMSQERKAQLAPAIKAALTKYGMKGSISVRNYSTLCVTIKSGKLDMIKNYNDETIARRTDLRAVNMAKDHIDVNPYWYHEHFTGDAKAFLTELFAACNNGNHDRSDIQTDYFDVGWYVDVNVGTWGKPYALTT